MKHLGILMSRFLEYLDRLQLQGLILPLEDRLPGNQIQLDHWYSIQKMLVFDLGISTYASSVY
jgi:hypothetical protein